MGKNSLSKIITSLKLNKQLLYFKSCKNNRRILDVLWIEGFIYGYSIYKKGILKVFLKYSEKGIRLLDNLVYSNKNIYYKNLKKLLILEVNLYIFMITEKGFFFFVNCLKNRMGGFILLKN